ncbi:MAG: hypothetical protein PHQ74_08270 [Crocinitomicaceae bacterium]|nr:hypothetical protein [Crocinitomicaceae bacterium]
MKNLKITLGALLLSFSFNYATAQSIGDRATAQTEKMDVQLGLASDQKAKVAEINFAIIDKNEAVMNDANMSAEVKKQAIQGNNEGRLQLLSTVLTPEQYKMYVDSQTQVKVRESSREIKSLKLAPVTPAEN